MAKNGMLHIKCNEAVRRVQDASQRYQIQQTFIDAEIESLGRTICRCHKLVLAANSIYFARALLEAGPGLAVLNIDSIQPIYARCLPKIIDYIYGRTVRISRAQLENFLEAAEAFKVSSLTKQIKAILLTGGTAATVDNNDGGDKKTKEMVTLRSIAGDVQLLVGAQRFLAQKQFVDIEILLNSSGKDNIRRNKTDKNNDKNDQQKSSTHPFKDNNNESVIYSGHRLVLASICPYLESILMENVLNFLDDDFCTRLNVCDVDPVYMRQFPQIFDFIYGLPVKMHYRQVWLFYDAARLLGLESDRLENVRLKATKMERRKLLNERLARVRGSNSTATDKNGQKIEKKCKNQSKLEKTERNFCGFFGPRLTVEEVAAIRNKWTVVHVAKNAKNVTVDWNRSSSDTIQSREFGKSVDFEEISVDRPTTAKMNSSEDDYYGTGSTSGSARFSLYSAEDGSSIKSSTDFHELKSMHRTAESNEFEFITQNGNICEKCGEIFTSVPEYEQHINLSHSCSSSLPKETVPELLSEEREPLYVCQFGSCERVYSSAADLGVHTKSHLNDRNFACLHCEYQAKNKANLNEHCKAKHGVRAGDVQQKQHGQAVKNTPKISCQFCSKCFVYNSQLTKHVQKRHLNAKPFQCEHCQYCCAEKQSLDVHVRHKHSMDRPYDCGKCGQSFASSSGLARHKRAVHGAPGLHTCDQCSKTFKEKRDLNVHLMRDHNSHLQKQFSCEICERKFNRKDHMLAHAKRQHSTDNIVYCL